MITGRVIYKFNGKEYKYDVDAIDTSTVCSFTITSASENALALLTSVDAEESDIPNRRFDVGLSSVNVQTPQYTDSQGKSKKKPVNGDFFCRFGALIRYAKMNCKTSNEIGYTGLSLASKEFEAVADREYIIHFPTEPDKVFAEVHLSYGDIKSIKIETDDFNIDLQQNYREDTKLFTKIVNGQKLGIKFDSEYLGFEVPTPTIEKTVDDNEMFGSIEEVQEAHPDKELAWLLGKNYIIVDDEHLEETCKYIADESHEYVYYDTETTGLNITFKSRIGQADQLVGVVLSVKFGESFFFPTQMKSIPNLCNGDHFYFMEKYMKPILEGKKLVAHNMSFDWKVAYIYDINANIVHDTMALIKLTLGAEKKNYPMSLKELAKILLGRDSLELSDLIRDNSWGETDVKFWDLPYELVRLYACADTDNTMGLLMYAEQADLLTKYNANKVYEIEIAFSYAVAYQEFYGHRIDINNVEKLRDELHQGQENYKKQMVDLIGHDFNPNSSTQLKTIMYDELGIPQQIDRVTGKVTTNKETLNKLAETEDINGEPKYPFCRMLAKYREYEGVRKVVDKFPENMTNDGYIFSSVMQYGTTTGRVSVNSPNYQSYNDPVKKNVIPREGFYMFDTDYSSVEYRVLGNMVGNKKIMQAFEDPDFDYHAYQAAHMYGIPYSAVTKKLRKAAKGINFGLPYGMGDESLGARVFGEPSPENTRKASALRQSYFKGQEDIRDWFEYHRNHGVNEGFTETYFGRRRYYYKQDFSESKIRRQAGNQVIQGTAADIYKTAVGRVFKRICREGWLGKVLFTGFIHDELLGEVSNDINPAIFLKMLREEFEVKITNVDGSPWCPLYMGFGYGMSWYEAKSVELPIKLQWEIVDKYGETGFPEWNGKGREFCDTIPDKLRDFEVRDIINQITDEQAQGNEIKVTLNNQVLDCVKTDSKYYTQGIKEYANTKGYNLDDENKTLEEISAWLEVEKNNILEYLDSKYHIQNLYKGESDNYKLEFAPCKTTQEAITQFCELHNVDRSKVNLLDIPEVEAKMETESTEIFTDEEDTTAKLQEMIDTRIDTYGLYLDVEKKQVTFLLIEPQYMEFIKQRMNHDGNGYAIILKDNVNKKLYTTTSYITSENIRLIQDMYIKYFKGRQ